VAQAMLGAAMAQKIAFDTKAWSGTHIFESELSRVDIAKHMVRADIYSDFPETDYSAYVEMFKLSKEGTING
jgi:hypothetical protein